VDKRITGSLVRSGTLVTCGSFLVELLGEFLDLFLLSCKTWIGKLLERYILREFPLYDVSQHVLAFWFGTSICLYPMVRRG
jgi:hypothetical protein